MKSKKASVTEFPLKLVSIALTIIILTLAGCQARTIKGEFENKTVQMINEEYPILFVNTFLESSIELNITQKKELNLNEKQDFKMKDIIILNTDASNKIMNEKKEEYLNLIKSFEVSTRNSNDVYILDRKREGDYSSYDEENYLKIEYSLEVPDLKKVLSNKNYFVSLLTNNPAREYAIIYFNK